MTTPRVIVDVIADITSTPDGSVCTFRGGGTARLRSGGPAPVLLSILQGRWKRRVPVYVEVAGDVITRLYIPEAAQTARVLGEKDGVVKIMLVPHQHVHTLSRKNPSFDALLATLTKRHSTGEGLLVTANDEHEIVHAAPLRHFDFPDLDLPPLPGPLERLQAWRDLAKVWTRRWWTTLFFRAITVKVPRLADAQAMFDLVAAKTCAPTLMATDCIPFLYPDSGCRARAHEMCRLMSDAGIEPDKLWVYASIGSVNNGGMVVQTRNKPTDCHVSWFFHVAPMLDVWTAASTWEVYVIDPSLFDRPVLRSEWLAAMNDPSLTEVVRSWDYFSTTALDPAPAFSSTNAELADKRELLRLRVASFGSPPYC